MKFEPVWISTVEFLGQYANLAVQARQHALNIAGTTLWMKQDGWLLYIDGDRQYPVRAITQLPHFGYGRLNGVTVFMPVPIPFLASGRLELEEKLSFTPQQFQPKYGVIRQLRSVRFEVQ